MAEDLDKQTREAFSPSTKATEAFRSEPDRTREAVRGANSPRSRENIEGDSRPTTPRRELRSMGVDNVSGRFRSPNLQVDELGRPVYETAAGTQFVERLDPDQRTLREKIVDTAQASAKGLKNWWQDPYIPEVTLDDVNTVVQGIDKDMRGTMFEGQPLSGVEALGMATAPAAPASLVTRPANSLGVFGRLGKESMAADPGVDAQGNKLPVSRGFDSNLRFELDDSQAKVNWFNTKIPPREATIDDMLSHDWTQYDGNMKPYNTLGEVLDHPELYRQYPGLEDTIFYADRNLQKTGVYGQFYPSTGHITINPELLGTDKFNETLFHEVNHLVDRTEGLLGKLGGSSGNVPPEVSSVFRDRRVVDVGGDPSITPFDNDQAYQHGASEAQARAAGYRWRMSLDDRRNVTPQETMLNNEPTFKPDLVWVESDDGVLSLVKNTQKYNEGGLVEDEDKTLEEYRTFFTNRTGMAEGGPVERDPVSGNEVPPGSEPHNVRDDIPAMLSEGEFVIPANVVNYYGVEKFDKMIDQAEAKLEEMDQKGRIGGEGDGMFLGGLYSNYPSSNVEVAQAPLFDMYQWIFPGISAFWETTATKPRSAPSKEKPEDKIKWVYQTPEREEGGGDVDPNSNLWTMDKGKFRQIASTGRFNPLDNLFGRLGEKFQGIASQSRKSYLRAALEVAKERGMDQDIVSGLEQKLESLGGYQEVEGEGLLGREGSRLNEITGPARWEQVYNYHSSQAGRKTIPDPKNPYTAPGADRPQRAGGPAINPVVDDVLTDVGTVVGSPSGGDGGTAAPVERDPLPGPEVRSGFMANPYKGQYLELSPFDREKLTEMGVDFRGRPYESSTEREGYEVYELDPSIVGPAMRAGMIPPSERPAFTAVMGPAIDYDRYVSNTPRVLIEPSPMGGPRRQSNQMDTPSIPSSTLMVIGGVDYGQPPELQQPAPGSGVDVGVTPKIRETVRPPITGGVQRLVTPSDPDSLSITGTEIPRASGTARGPSGGGGWGDNQGAETADNVIDNVIDTVVNAGARIGEARRNMAEAIKQRRDERVVTESPFERQMDSMLGRSTTPRVDGGGRGDVDRGAIGDRAAVWESRGEDDSSNAGPSVMSEGPSQPSNPQPYNEPSPSRSVNIGGGRGGNEPPQEDYDKGGQPFNKGGYVQRPVSYAKGGYVTRKKGK